MTKLTYRNLRQILNFEFQPKHFASQITIDLTLLSTIVILFQTPLAALNSFIMPLFMFRQFSILHEAVHGLTHSSALINDFIGVIAGAFCFTPYTVWRTAHLKHHYWTGNIAQDPTFSILKNFSQSSTLQRKLLTVTWNLGFPWLGILQHAGFWTFGLKKLNSIEAKLSLLVPIAIYAALFQLSSFNLAICFLGFLIYFRIWEEMVMPQHVGLYSDDKPDHHPPAWDQIAVTRTWYLNSFLEKHVVLNMNYHTEHHMFPDLPWHQLAHAHKLLQSESRQLNMISMYDWMKTQRQRLFGDFITPVKMSTKTSPELTP